MPFLVREDLSDWGHAKRAEGIDIVEADYLFLVNDDDSYDTTFVEKLLTAVDGYDVAYCGWNSIPHCTFRTHNSTSGNFIVRTGLARAVGYDADYGYAADGDFIERLNANGAVIAPKVDEVLYFHNHQP